MRPVSRVPRDSEQRLLAPPVVGEHPEIAKKNASAMVFRVVVVAVSLVVFAFLIYNYVAEPRDTSLPSEETSEDH